jgi:hypothetical protein
MSIKNDRDNLKKMLDKSPDGIDGNVPDAEETIPGLQAEPLIGVDFVELREECQKEAQTMITNAITFMIPPEMMAANEYIKDKINMDVMTLSGMVYQLRTNEVMQRTLMEQINQGQAQPRMFEVFSGMSKTIGELNKQLIQTIEAIKETYKGFKSDVKERQTEELGPATSQAPGGLLTTSAGNVVTRGTKELINNVKKIKKDQAIDDASLIPPLEI